MVKSIDEGYGYFDGEFASDFANDVYGTPDSITFNGRRYGLKDNCVAFGWFPTYVDEEKRLHDFKFLSGENAVHWDIAWKATNMMLGNAKDHISDRSKSVINNDIVLKSTVRGRLWKDCKVIVFYHEVSSKALVKACTKLGIVDTSEYLVIMGDENACSLGDLIFDDVSGENIDSNDGSILSIGYDDLEAVIDYNSTSSKQAELTKRLGKMTIAQYNSIIHPNEDKRHVDVMDESYDGTGDTIFDDKTRKRFDWKDDDAVPFIFLPFDLDDHYELFVGEGGWSHMMLANEALEKILGKAESKISYDYKAHLATEVYMKGYGRGRYWKNANAMAFWYPPESDVVEAVVKRLNLDIDTCEIVYDCGGEKSITVAQYLADPPSHTEDKESDIKKKMRIDKRIEAEIRRANDVGESFMAQRYKDLGGMTIAQYKSIIHPYEGKKSINVMKESKNNPYIEKVRNYTSLMAESLSKGDFSAYESAKGMLDETVSNMREKESLKDELKTSNFGVLNHIFESELPRLIKTNKKAVRDVVKLIREDKVLSSEFKFMNAVRKINESIEALDKKNVDVKSLVNEYASSMREGISKGDIAKANKRLREALVENNVVPSLHVPNGVRKFYEASSRIFENKQTISNAASYADDLDSIVEYARSNKVSRVERANPIDEIAKYERDMREKLTESERELVKTITDARTPLADKRKENLFNTLKNECMSKIDKMISEDPSNEGLHGLRARIEEQKFNSSTIVMDIAKLLEIRDVLMDD